MSGARRAGSGGAGANPRRVKEESHLEEMRAALRGERERAEQARQRSFENVRTVLEPRPEPVAEAPVEAPPPPEPERRRGLFGFLRER
jgi:hypothetical protein